jgi:hypothetical protein
MPPTNMRPANANNSNFRTIVAPSLYADSRASTRETCVALQAPLPRGRSKSLALSFSPLLSSLSLGIVQDVADTLARYAKLLVDRFIGQTGRL